MIRMARLAQIKNPPSVEIDAEMQTKIEENKNGKKTVANMVLKTVEKRYQKTLRKRSSRKGHAEKKTL